MTLDHREWTLLCRLSEIPDGRSKGFDPLGLSRDTMFAVRRGRCVYGYRNSCPHHDFTGMASKKDEFLNADGSRIRCAAHGALFRIEDGFCDFGPCEGKSLDSVTLSVRGDDIFLGTNSAP